MLKFKNLIKFIIQSELRPLSQLRVMRDVQTSNPRKLDTKSGRCTHSHFNNLSVIYPTFSLVHMIHVIKGDSAFLVIKFSLFKI